MSLPNNVESGNTEITGTENKRERQRIISVGNRAMFYRSVRAYKGGMMEEDKRQRRYIRIRDADMWAKIDKLMTLPKYSKSFNKVANDAMYYGLEILLKKNFETTEEEYANTGKKQIVRKIDGVNEAYFMEVVKLLKEVIINATINKSLLSSLYHAQEAALNRKVLSGAKFTEGRYSETPEYLTDYEIQGLRELRY